MLIQYITNDWKTHWLKRVGTLKNIQLLKYNYFIFNYNYFNYYFIKTRKLKGDPID